ncbi:MAG: NAD(+)/NADH kinase [Candidatus Hydrogenedentes bacterium]|nr:NAD(+)/NADH kinase [Candidatus Hydrogenedentota bacterium]MBI3118465.1 NAD(+)/NADH kinase [Candidatus Hydrogenedentota bacterium]
MSSLASTEPRPQPVRVLIFGAQAKQLEDEVAKHENLIQVADQPDVVVSYGGDGTLLAAELRWPGLPKVPILNSYRGHRCIPHPPNEVIAGLARHALVKNVYTKLECVLSLRGQEPRTFTALNEFATHMGRINSAVRFKLWLNDEPYEDGLEILGDGFLVCTPFGSTAYYNKISRGIFTKGIGIAFKATTEHTNHLVLPDTVVCRFLITRGPTILAYDSAQEYFELNAGDELVVRKHPKGATILTCGPVKRLDEPF